MKENAQTKRLKYAKECFDWYETFVMALAGVVLLSLFGVRMAQVSGRSMEPTLYGGEQVLVQTLTAQPKHGDIVVADGYIPYGDPIIKRIIGMGGDEIDIDFETGVVKRNGEILQEPYIADATKLSFDVEFPVIVPKGHVFLMGDNRPGSKDSRSSEIGMIDERALLGKVILRTGPLNRFGVVK